MITKPAAYSIGPESVGDYLLDLEKRWGVVVTLDLRMMQVTPQFYALVLTIGVPNPEHQRELQDPPIFSLVLTTALESNLWWAFWDGLYQWDRMLEAHMNKPE